MACPLLVTQLTAIYMVGAWRASQSHPSCPDYCNCRTQEQTSGLKFTVQITPVMCTNYCVVTARVNPNQKCETDLFGYIHCWQKKLTPTSGSTTVQICPRCFTKGLRRICYSRRCTLAPVAFALALRSFLPRFIFKILGPRTGVIFATPMRRHNL